MEPKQSGFPCLWIDISGGDGNFRFASLYDRIHDDEVSWLHGLRAFLTMLSDLPFIMPPANLALKVDNIQGNFTIFKR